MNNQHSKIRGSSDIIPLPAFRDNYIWLLRHGRFAAVVDPGDAAVVETALQQQHLQLCAILLTHHHDDHIGGVAELAARHRPQVYGPAGEDIPAITRHVREGDEIVLNELDRRFSVLEIPGHTRTHIAYLAPGVLFPGDTLFSAGCGRLLGGTPDQMYESLRRLAQLPGDTGVYCAHEYTLANLAFSRAAEPINAARDARQAECEALRREGRPTLPSSIEREKQFNPFLRTDVAGLVDAVAAHSGVRPPGPRQCFAALRAWKDVF